MGQQNRMTPEGELVAADWRGALTGNRGCLHVETPEGPVLGTRRWAHQAWVSCALSFRGRWRPLMPPRRWTALFFWDEAAAFAAGHLPCGECRYAAHDAMRHAWAAAGLPGKTAAERHRHLHAHRVRRDRTRVTVEAATADLPDGTVVLVDSGAMLIASRRGHRWQPAAGGWQGNAVPLPSRAQVLTPWPVVGLFSAGYRPDWRLVR
ncbi:MAG: hypothetical protein AAF577_07440 [Pseudomonadota bacterium]